MTTSNSFLDRLIERLDKLDPSRVQTYVLKLVREKGFLETIFNTIEEGVLVIDQDINIHFLNSRVKEFLGLPDNCEGQRLDRVIKDVDWSSLIKADPQEWHRISFQEIEVFYPRQRILSFYIVPLPERGESNEIAMAALIFHDVTETRRDTKKAVESKRVEAITKLAAGVAHEIGNPLNSLDIHLQLLDRKIEGGNNENKEEAKELVEVARKEVQRLDSIVDNFLKAVRPGRTKFEKINLQKLLEESLTFMRTEIEDKNLQVEALVPEQLPRVYGDPSQLKQAFYNIIKNSIQAMAEGDRLDIYCDVKPEFIELKFVDTGKGISADHLSHIMEPYYTTRANGTGLGLVMVERILREHGAEFGIDSSEGEGTVFTVRFPRHERQMRLLKAPER